MNDLKSTDLIAWLARRVAHPLPGWKAQMPWQPELSFGRHFAQAPVTARQAAVLVLLYPQPDRWMIPLTLRPADMLDHAGQVSFPGGVIEPGERSEDAARRELEEELGVLPRDLTLVGQLSPLYLFNSNFSITPWLAITRSRPDWSPNQAEVAELIEAPLDELRLPSAQMTWTRSIHGITSTVPTIEYQQHRIWALTRMILGELFALVDEFDCADYAARIA